MFLCFQFTEPLPRNRGLAKVFSKFLLRSAYIQRIRASPPQTGAVPQIFSSLVSRTRPSRPNPRPHPHPPRLRPHRRHRHRCHKDSPSRWGPSRPGGRPGTARRAGSGKPPGARSQAGPWQHRGGLPVLFLLAGGVLPGHRPAQVNGDCHPRISPAAGPGGLLPPGSASRRPRCWP